MEQDEIKKLSIHNNSKLLLSEFSNPSESILNNYIAKGLITSLKNSLKDNTLSGMILQCVDSSDMYIRIPSYIETQKRKVKDYEIIIDDNGRYGVLLEFLSNKKTFNFSVRIMDMTIVKYNNEIHKQERGSYRSYTLTDKYGNISSNWKSIKIASDDEFKRLLDNHEKIDSIRVFEKLVSVAAGDLIYGIRYFLLKCYIKRLEEEKKYWQNIKKSIPERLKNNLNNREWGLILKEIKQ